MRRSVISYTIGEREDGIVLGQFLKAKGFSHRLTVRIKAAQGLAVWTGLRCTQVTGLRPGRQWR